MPDAYAVDTGVFLRWFVPQDGWKHARELRDAFLGGTIALYAVDSVRYELAHVLRTKGLLRKLFDQDRYLAAVRTLDDLGVTVAAVDADVLERACDLAARRMLRVFDALVVDHALQRGLTLVTADVKLVRAVDDLLSTELLRGVGSGGSAP